MRLARICLIVFFAVFGMSRSSLADFSFSTNAFASALAESPFVFPPISDKKSETDDVGPGSFTADATASANALDKTGSEVIAVSIASADLASLHVSATANAIGGGGNSGALVSSYVSGRVEARAGWRDTTVIDIPSKPIGSKVIVRADLTLTGHLSGEATISPSFQNGTLTFPQSSGLAEGAVSLGNFSTDATFFNVLASDGFLLGTFKKAPLAGIDTRQPTLDDIIVEHTMTNGRSYTIGFDLSVGGDVAADRDNHGFFDGNFSDTLHWGGIQSVRDAVTGELIEDWTIRSASGYDYSKPFAVPEPSGIVLLGIALCVGLAVRRKSALAVGG